MVKRKSSSKFEHILTIVFLLFIIVDLVIMIWIANVMSIYDWADKKEMMSLTNTSYKLYPDMKFANSTIKFSLTDCNSSQQDSIYQALSTISNLTPLSFNRVSKEAQLTWICYKDVKRLTVLGEGGSSLDDSFREIKLGSISLYGGEVCNWSLIEVHELLHVLGFSHNNNKQSILYPYISCDQKIDESIIQELNKTYAKPKEN